MHESERPHLLLITTDQQRFDTIHAAGASHMFTPHLNWLCDQGIRYSRCYSTSPVCIPARAMLMTGREGLSTGLTTYSTSPVPMATNATLPGVLTAAGYQTRAIGKMHFHPMRAHYGFEHMILPHDYHRYLQRHPHLGTPKNHGIGENEMEPVFSTIDENHSLTHWLVDQAIDFYETRDPLRPSFCWLSFTKPHPPFDCDRRYWELYDGIDLPEPVRGDWSASFGDVPLGLRDAGTNRLNRAFRFSSQQMRNIRRAYYACISQIDYNLGCLFARMREMGLLENTWIVFTSDHGDMLGDHWLGAKSIFLEGSAHVPMIVRPPVPHADRSALCGTVRDDLVSLADVMPTLLGRARASVPVASERDGRDLLCESYRPRDSLVGACGSRHVIYRDCWAYSFDTAGGSELLFDLRSDPYEQRELIRAGAPGRAGDALTGLREQMTQHLLVHAPDAVRDGRLVSASQPRSLQATNRDVWPGFHSPTEPSDVLH